MDKRKKLSILIALFVLVFALFIDINASSTNNREHIKDLSSSIMGEGDGDILTAEQAILDFIGTHQAEILVLISQGDMDLNNFDEFADTNYLDEGYGLGENRTGLVFAVDYTNREYNIRIYGDLKPIIDDYQLESLLDLAEPYVKNQDISGLVAMLLDELEDILTSEELAGYPSKELEIEKDIYYPTSIFSEILYRATSLNTIIVSLVGAGIVVFIFVRAHNSEIKTDFKTYELANSLNVSVKKDVFINKTVTRTRVAKSSNTGTSSGRSGTGGSSGSSGSSGRGRGF